MFAYEWMVLLQRVPSNPPTRPVTAGRQTNEMVFAIYAACLRYTWGTPRVHIPSFIVARLFNINTIVDGASFD